MQSPKIQTRRATNDDLGGVLELIKLQNEEELTSRHELIDPTTLK